MDKKNDAAEAAAAAFTASLAIWLRHKSAVSLFKGMRYILYDSPAYFFRCAVSGA